MRAEFVLVRYRQVAPYTDRVEPICTVTGEATDGNPNAAIRSAIADLLRLRPDAVGCVRAACEDAQATGAEVET